MESDAASNSAASTPPRRWRLRFSLRTLVFVIPVLALPLSWIGNEVRRYHQDQAAAMVLWSQSDPIVLRLGGHWNLSPLHTEELCQGRLYSPITELRLNRPACDTGGLTPSDWDAASDLLGLRYLCINGYQGQERGKTFAHLPMLEGLELTDGQLSSNDLRQIGELQHLKLLWCENISPSLESSVRSPSFQEDGLHLPELTISPGAWPQLQSLKLFGMQVNSTSMQAISGIPNLHGLEIDMCDFDPRSLDFLAQSPQLNELKIAPNLMRKRSGPIPPANVDEQMLQRLGRSPKLESLQLSEVTLTDLGGAERDWPSRWLQLAELSLHNAYLSAVAIREIAAIPNLTTLSFTGDLLRLQSLGEIGAAKNLEKLTLLFEDGPDAIALEQISQLPRLEMLVVSGTNIDDEAMRHIAHLNRLTDLSLYGVRVSDRGLAMLTNHPRLRRIYVDGGDFSAHALQSIATIPNISFRESSFHAPGFNPSALDRLRLIEERGGDVKAFLMEQDQLSEAPLFEDLPSKGPSSAATARRS